VNLAGERSGISNQYLKELIYLIFMAGIHKSLQIASAVKLLISLCLGTAADLTDYFSA
jgi:hypothetical protein